MSRVVNTKGLKKTKQSKLTVSLSGPVKLIRRFSRVFTSCKARVKLSTAICQLPLNFSWSVVRQQAVQCDVRIGYV